MLTTSARCVWHEEMIPLTDLPAITAAPEDTTSEALSLARDVTAALAAGEADLDTYTQTLRDLRDGNCSRCQQVRWEYEVPRTEGGAIRLCHDCFWKSGIFDALVLRVESGEVVQFDYGLLMHELIRAFRDRHQSIEYAEAGLALTVMWSPIEQQCKEIESVPGHPPTRCDEKTTERVCPRCGAQLWDAEAAWADLVVRAKERQTTETGDE